MELSTIHCVENKQINEQIKYVKTIPDVVTTFSGALHAL